MHWFAPGFSAIAHIAAGQPTKANDRSFSLRWLRITDSYLRPNYLRPKFLHKMGIVCKLVPKLWRKIFYWTGPRWTHSKWDLTKFDLGTRWRLLAHSGWVDFESTKLDKHKQWMLSKGFPLKLLNQIINLSRSESMHLPSFLIQKLEHFGWLGDDPILASFSLFISFQKI